jgi:hypothetical protein
MIMQNEIAQYLEYESCPESRRSVGISFFFVALLFLSKIPSITRVLQTLREVDRGSSLESSISGSRKVCGFREREFQWGVALPSKDDCVAQSQ